VPANGRAAARARLLGDFRCAADGVAESYQCEKEPVPDKFHLVQGDRPAVNDKTVSGVKTADPRRCMTISSATRKEIPNSRAMT
jgi:hypothetical protein